MSAIYINISCWEWGGPRGISILLLQFLFPMFFWSQMSETNTLKINIITVAYYPLPDLVLGFSDLLFQWYTQHHQHSPSSPFVWYKSTETAIQWPGGDLTVRVILKSTNHEQEPSSSALSYPIPWFWTADCSSLQIPSNQTSRNAGNRTAILVRPALWQMRPSNADRTTILVPHVRQQSIWSVSFCQRSVRTSLEMQKCRQNLPCSTVKQNRA